MAYIFAKYINARNLRSQLPPHRDGNNNIVLYVRGEVPTTLPLLDIHVHIIIIIITYTAMCERERALGGSNNAPPPT